MGKPGRAAKKKEEPLASSSKRSSQKKKTGNVISRQTRHYREKTGLPSVEKRRTQEETVLAAAHRVSCKPQKGRSARRVFGVEVAEEAKLPYRVVRRVISRLKGEGRWDVPKKRRKRQGENAESTVEQAEKAYRLSERC